MRKYLIYAVPVVALIAGAIALGVSAPTHNSNPSPTASFVVPSIPGGSQRATDPSQEALPVVPVRYGSAVKISGVKVVASNPATGEKQTVVSVRIENTGQPFEFESRYGFQFIDGEGTGSLAADTVGFQSVGKRNGEVQIDAVGDNFRAGTLLLIERETGMPVGAWS